MGKKRKNSNYVTEKKIKAREEALKAQKAYKTKKLIITIVALVLAAACLVTGIILISNAVENKRAEDAKKQEELDKQKEQINLMNALGNDKPTEESDVNSSFKVTHRATIEVNGYGTVNLDLYGEEAPETVNNFVKLASNGFYNGLTFHRIMSGFMAQGGCPKGNGTGGNVVDGKEVNIKGEFSKNGVENDVKHVRGTISMARGDKYNSASSQFFIVHKTSQGNSLSLDNNYAAFGMVTSGMNVIDKICYYADPTDNNGTIAKNNQPVIKSITVQEVTE